MLSRHLQASAADEESHAHNGSRVCWSQAAPSGCPWLSAVAPAAAHKGVPRGRCQEPLALVQSLVALFGHLQASTADKGMPAVNGSAEELQAAEVVILQDLDMMLKHDADLGSVSSHINTPC